MSEKGPHLVHFYETFLSKQTLCGLPRESPLWQNDGRGLQICQECQMSTWNPSTGQFDIVQIVQDFKKQFEPAEREPPVGPAGPTWLHN